MVLYDYRCDTCGNEFELERPMGLHHTASCPNCGGEAGRVFNPSSIVFTGSGFYNTDERGDRKGDKETVKEAKKETPKETKKESPKEGTKD